MSVLESPSKRNILSGRESVKRIIEKHKKEKIPKSEYNDILQIFVIFFIAVPPTLFIIDFESGINSETFAFKFLFAMEIFML